jgi:dTMP kinase
MEWRIQKRENKRTIDGFRGQRWRRKEHPNQISGPKTRRRGEKAVLLHEPGGTEPGEEMRHILKHGNYNLSPRAELLLMNASRAQLVDTVILPALARGEDVLLDRFFYSTIAYQGYGRNLPLPTVRSVINAAVGELQPEHVFLLRIPLEVCLERRGGRQEELPNMGKDRFEKEDVEFFARVEQGYAQIAAADPQHVHVIDATKGPQEVFSEVCKHL